MVEKNKPYIIHCDYGEEEITAITVTHRGKRKAVINFITGTDMNQVNVFGVAQDVLDAMPGTQEVVIPQPSFTIRVTRNKTTTISR